MSYSAQLYRDPDTGRTRWAVLHGPTRTWSFATRYGKRAAKALASRLRRLRP